MLTHRLAGSWSHPRGDNRIGATRPSPTSEALVLCAAAAVYFGVRVVVEGGRDTAVRNAERLLSVEAALRIDVEAAVQRHVVDDDVLRTLANLSYVWLHWPLIIIALVVLMRHHPERFRRLRTALFVSGAVGLVLFTVLPMAPPRFMPGFVGTVSDAARRHHLTYPLSWTNQFAAFPSFHAGWTLITCMALAGIRSGRVWRIAALLPAVLVTGAVVATGNHYVVDTLAGIAIAVGAYAWSGRSKRASVATTSSSPVWSKST